MRFLLALLLGCSLMPVSIAADLKPTQKRAGLCFRGDDNHSPAKWRKLTEIFERYGYPVCASLNLLKNAHDAKYLAFVKDLQSRGHEVMDHSPSHRVFSMELRTAEEAAAYVGKPGVDHVRGKTVYFQYAPPDPPDPRWTGLADVEGDRFTASDIKEPVKWRWNPLIMFEGNRGVYMLAGDGDFPSRLKSLWGEDTVNLPARKRVRFFKLLKSMVSVAPDALRYQTRITREICKRHGIKPPVTWIQPGGSEPVLHRSLIKQVLGDEFGYTAAATYPEASLKCFNEYDPNGDKRFGMQWGSFQEDRYDLTHNKKVIAEGLAKHYVMVGHSHLSGRKEIGGWEGYLRNTEELLKWCREKDIPVRTLSQWADLLYTRPTDLSVNVFPDIATDLNEDGQPDGITLGPGVTIVDRAPSGLSASLSVPPNTRACIVHNLAGIEKGANVFAVHLNGPVGAKVQARFRSLDATIATEWLTFETTQTGWQSLKGRITVPEPASRLTIDIMRRDRAEAPLFINGVSLTGSRQ